MARTVDSRPYVFSFNSYATGHGIYKENWSPVLGEILYCEREPRNEHDRFAVALRKDGEIVGHVPRTISKACFYTLLAGGIIYAVVNGERQNKRQNGLEVPMIYHVKGPRQYTLKSETYIVSSMK